MILHKFHWGDEFMRKNATTIFVLCLLCITTVMLTVFRINETKTVMLGSSIRPKIIIDAGHGGMDGGAVGYDEIVEKNINLSIAMKLKDLLVLSGFDVVMVREQDEAIFDKGVEGVKNQKTSDMYNRLKIIKDNPDAIFVSIHQNKFPESKYSGAQMFYSPNSPHSETLAQIMQTRFKTMLQPENNREIKRADSDLFLLYQATIPAMIIECGFLSNPEEALKLSSDQYQNDMTYTILTGLLEFIETMNT